MRLGQLQERKRRAWWFTFIAAFWAAGIFFVVERLAPKSESNTEIRLANLAKYDDQMDEQEELILQLEELYTEIKLAQFGLYQEYYYDDLDNRVKGVIRPQSFSTTFSERGSRVLQLLLHARHELRKKEENLIVIGEDLMNCRDGIGAKPE